MNSKKKELLDETHKNFSNSMLLVSPADKLEKFVVEDVMGYGTTIDERVFGVSALKELVKRQVEQGASMQIKHEIKEIHRRYNESEDVAIIVNEIKIILTSEEGTNELNPRISTVLQYFFNVLI